MREQPDILIFFSDQHNAMMAGFAGDEIVRTPNLDKLAAEGTVFSAAYTSCPLCVPARMSMLTGQLPSNTGIFTNNDAMPSDQATFLHSLAAEGYETVLCGRMHFKGEDQRHGFTKRIMGDITPLFYESGRFHEEQGPFAGTLNKHHCLDLIGGGTSPVLEYDRAVIKAALDYLGEEHDKPQCIVVGTYGPHFSYVAPPELYQYYLDEVKLPATYDRELNYTQSIIADKEQRSRYSILDDKTEAVDGKVMRQARAAYYGMITHLDAQIGEVYAAWEDYLAKCDHQGLFVYLSDHGDTVGEHNIFGKQTFYEGSARIPLVFTGSGVKQNKVIKSPVSIMDIGPTLCEMVEATLPPDQDGRSLWRTVSEGEAEPDRYVLSEFVQTDAEKQLAPGRMLRQGRWKFVTYTNHADEDLLFDLESDPEELTNVIAENEEVASDLRNKVMQDWDQAGIVIRYRKKQAHHKLLGKWSKAVKPEEAERWRIPEAARKLPEVY